MDTQPVIAGAADREREQWDDQSRGNVSWYTLISGDMTPTVALSAGVMDVPPRGGILQPHRHREDEIYYIAAGSGVVTIDGVEKPIAAGMAVFIPGDAEHSVRNDAAEILRVFYVFPTDRFSDVVYRFTSEAS